MTFDEMRTEAEILYEFVNSSAAPGFEESEWGVIFTAAQRRIVRRILQEGIAANAENMIAISPLIQHQEITDLTADTYYKNSDGTAALTIDTSADNVDQDFFWILDEYVGTATITRIPLKRITFAEYQKNLDNPYGQPDRYEGYWVLSTQDPTTVNATPATYGRNKPVFISDGTAITSYKLVGVKHPDTYPIGPGTPDNNCLLNESVHADIVKEAVILAHLSVLDAQAFQMAVSDDIRLKN